MKSIPPALPIATSIALSIVFALLAVFCLAGMLLPDRSVLEQRIVLPADPASVFARLDGFAALEQVSPWAGIRPSLRFRRSGPELGVGARLHWIAEDGSQGEAVISRSNAPRQLRIDIVAGAPRVRDLQLHFELQPATGGTELVAQVVVDHHGELASRWRGALSVAAQVAAADLMLGLRRLDVLLSRAAPAS